MGKKRTGIFASRTWDAASLRPYAKCSRSRHREIDQALLAVNLGDDDLDLVAELELALGLAADEGRARGIEQIEVVAQRGDGHHAKRAGLGDLDEEAVVADVGDDRVEHGLLLSLRLAVEVLHELHFH